MRQIELRLRGLMRELDECREALSRAVASYDDEVAARRVRRRRFAASFLALGACFVAGMAGENATGLSAVRTPTPASACAPGPGTITHASFSIKGSTATATYTVAPGCEGAEVTLASYSMLGEPQSVYPQTLFDSAASTTGGMQSLTINLPSCYWQLDLVTGDALSGIDAKQLFGPRRAISTTGGAIVCSPPVTTTTTTTPTTSTTDTVTTTTPTTTMTPPPTTLPAATTTTSSTIPAPPPPTTTNAPSPPSTTDVAVRKVADRTDAVVGQQITYLVTVVNNGPAAASDVVVVDQIPAEESLVSVSDVACVGTQIVTCDFGTLAVGASRAVTLVALARQTGTATNGATVTTSTPEATTANNHAEVSLPISGPFVPPPLRCARATLHHRTLVAGRRTVVLVVARRSGRPAVGLRLAIHGPGIETGKTTDTAGVARFVLRPTGVGVLRVQLVQPAACGRSLLEVPVPGAFRPPQLTG